MSKAVLVDVTRCIGCRSCQVACKQWNELPAEETRFTGGGNPTDLSATTWTRVDFHAVTDKGGKPVWRTVKNQCMHCEEPACVSVCPVGAMKKTADGPVIYDDAACIGCRYCMMACPFSVPAFEWQESLSLVRKCQMCNDRIAAGQPTACAAACPTGALTFGERDQLLAEAERRIVASPEKYIDHIYGKDEVGGTAWLYLSDLPFEQIGLNPAVTRKPVPELSWKAMQGVPWIMAGGTALLTGLYLYTHRRDALEAQKKEGGR